MDALDKKSQRFSVKCEQRLFNVISSSNSNLASVNTFTLLRCKDISLFLSAVESVLNANPILSGYATSGTHAVTGQKGYCVVPNHYSFADICKVVHWPSDQPFDIPSDLKEMMQYLRQKVRYHVPDLGTGWFQLKNGSRLFAVTVIDQLPDNHVVLHISLSHAIADGYTYYKIITQINEVMKYGKIQTPLRWNELTVIQDEQAKLSWYALLLLTVYICVDKMVYLYRTMWRTSSSTNIAVVDDHVVCRLKTSMKRSDSTGYYLTTNDILCSAIAYRVKANFSVTVLNLRQQLDLTNVAGNYCSLSLGYKCHDPDAIRRCNKGMKGLHDLIEENAISFSSVFNHASIITNWTSLCEFVEIPCEDYHLLCHAPGYFDLDVSYVFKATKDKVCVLSDTITVASITDVNDANDLFGNLFM